MCCHKENMSCKANVGTIRELIWTLKRRLTLIPPLIMKKIGGIWASSYSCLFYSIGHLVFPTGSFK